jgi:PIN domain nuclease of toxin-antitoxin system
VGVLNLLLDTHCWLWLKLDPDRLPSPVRRRILRDPTKLVLSSACVMEIVIKHAAGRLKLKGDPAQLVAELLGDGVAPLSATVEHALRIATLPPNHRDPFDRLLVAQALVEGLTLVTADPQVLAYGMPSIDARK